MPEIRLLPIGAESWLPRGGIQRCVTHQIITRSDHLINFVREYPMFLSLLVFISIFIFLIVFIWCYFLSMSDFLITSLPFDSTMTI